MDGIFIADRQGNYIDVNARGCRMLGYTRREILRMNLRDLIPAEDLKATPLRLEDMLTGQTVSNERRLLCKNGKLLPVEIGGRRLSNGNLLGIVRDRSAREKAEMESRALAHFAVENPTPMLRVDADGKIVFANDASRPLLKSWKTRVGRSLPREWKTFIGERLGGGSRAQAEVVCGDRVFSILFVPAPKDGFVNLYGQDVTEEKQEARRYHFLLDQSHDAIFILDLQGGYIQANQRTAEMLGYSLEELQHLNVQDTSAEPEISRELLKRLLGGEHIPAYERLLRRKDGSVFPVEINMELARDANGQPLHVQSIVRDISERKTIEQELRASEAKYRTLIEQLPAVVYLDVLDGKGTSLFVSPKLEEILGVTAEEWL
ncbi:MAG: PAS domain S-box protein, partial [Anaerolineales bacterium]|nr:PAS domain S-box protein [Anaerolineales bacterium]